MLQFWHFGNMKFRNYDTSATRQDLGVPVTLELSLGQIGSGRGKYTLRRGEFSAILSDSRSYMFLWCCCGLKVEKHFFKRKSIRKRGCRNRIKHRVWGIKDTCLSSKSGFRRTSIPHTMVQDGDCASSRLNMRPQEIWIHWIWVDMAEWRSTGSYWAAAGAVLQGAVCWCSSCIIVVRSSVWYFLCYYEESPCQFKVHLKSNTLVGRV